MSVQAKLDKILLTLDKLTVRLDNIETKLENFNERLNLVEQKLEKKCQEFESALSTAVSKPHLEALEAKFNNFVESINADQLMREAYEKRLNILIHGLPEKDNAWETREKTRIVFDNFLREGLKLDPSTVNLDDIHRLPQGPHRTGKIRPIIIKMATNMDKQKIYSSLKNLKNYNTARSSNANDSSPVFVTDHLPKLFQNQKKALIPHFKEARSQNKKTYWKAENGQYHLYINNRIFIP